MNKKIISTAAACAAIFSYGIAISITGPVLEQIEKSYQINSAKSGLLFTFLSAGFLVSVFLKRFLASYLHTRTTLLLASAVTGVALLSFSFTENLSQGLAVFAVIGLAGGFIQVSANSGIAMLHQDNRASMLNVLHLFFGTGALVAPLLAGAIAEQSGYAGVFMVSAFIAIPAVILSLGAAFPDSNNSSMKTRPEKEMSDNTKATADNNSVFFLLKDRYVWLLALSILLYMGAEMGINSWSVMYLEKEMGLEKFTSSSFLSYFWFLMTAGRLLGMLLAKKYMVSTLLAASSLVAAVAGALFIFAPDGILAGVGVALVGFFFAGTYPFLLGLGSNRHPQAVEQITTILIASAGIGFMLFPWLTGLLSSTLTLAAAMKVIWAAIILLFFTSAAIYFSDRSSASA